VQESEFKFGSQISFLGVVDKTSYHTSLTIKINLIFFSQICTGPGSLWIQTQSRKKHCRKNKYYGFHFLRSKVFYLILCSYLDLTSIILLLLFHFFSLNFFWKYLFLFSIIFWGNCQDDLQSIFPTGGNFIWKIKRWGSLSTSGPLMMPKIMYHVMKGA